MRGREEASGFVLGFGLEGLRDHVAAGFFHEDFHAAFRILQLLLAIARERDAFLEKLHRVIEREIRSLELLDDFLKPREAALEFRLFWLRRVSFLRGS